MRLRARGGHVWACRGVGIRQGFCAGTPDGGSVCRQSSGDAVSTIAYLLKESINMRYGMFRLQEVIAQLTQQRVLFTFSSTKGTASSRPSGSTAPQIPIDNNAVARAIRPLAVGRRNSLFIGSPEAGMRAAILYTMVRECQRVKVDSEARLTAVLLRLPDYRGDYLDLLPGMLELPEAGVSATSVKA